MLEEILNVDYAPPPETIEDMVDESAAVVVARYEGRRTSSRSDTLSLSTRFALQIVERIKSDNRLPPDDRVEINSPVSRPLDTGRATAAEMEVTDAQSASSTAMICARSCSTSRSRRSMRLSV